MHKLIVILVLFLVVAGCSKDDAIYQEVNTTYTAANSVDTTLKIQAYPNPFNSIITIGFLLTKSNNTTIEVANLLGEIIFTVPAVNAISGNNQVVLDLSQLASGVYFLKVTSGNHSAIKRILKN